LTTISAAEFTNVKQETSDVVTLLSFEDRSAAFTIYAEMATEIKRIDVSLKYFVADDVRKLMYVIHDKRPNLDLIGNWL
jgi:hypothetical protein